MPRLQEITFAEYAQSEIILACHSIEAGHAGEDGGCHSGNDGDNVDREEDDEVATAALGREQPRAVQAKGRQHCNQVKGYTSLFAAGRLLAH